MVHIGWITRFLVEAGFTPSNRRDLRTRVRYRVNSCLYVEGDLLPHQSERKNSRRLEEWAAKVEVPILVSGDATSGMELR